MPPMFPAKAVEEIANVRSAAQSVDWKRFISSSPGEPNRLLGWSAGWWMLLGEVVPHSRWPLTTVSPYLLINGRATRNEAAV